MGGTSPSGTAIRPRARCPVLTSGAHPVLLGITVLVAAATVAGSLLADVAYAVLDPRVRYVHQ